MISMALQHCYGIGPVRMQKLNEQGIGTWFDVVRQQDRLLIDHHMRNSLLAESKRCIDALENRNIAYFVESFDTSDHWRIMAEYFDEISYLDIETSGLGWDDYTTMICVYHKGELHYFCEDSNMDDFLDLLEDMKLVVTFNGSSFDIPRILSTFHIPELDCAHIDLRWIAYHKGFRGGLKRISRQLGIRRPADIEYVSGDEAVFKLLKRYCAADVLLLYLLAAEILGTEGLTVNNRIHSDEMWLKL